ncbi:SCO family protein [Oceanibium sediminis]|uniref:SCO family protein n=1 Tax=Oceanibium sediminis TaxID=2026339 RepID=UPI000DD4289D|nr:SCO family protein [Oceanibium sediminis]
MTRTTLIAALSALLVLLLASAGWILLSNRESRFAQCEGGSVAGGSDLIGGPFTLVRHDGVRVTDAEVIDELSLLYFGYTYCPDVCPFDVARNAEAVDILEERGIQVKPIFITVDPARDTPEVMADFISYMHPRMVGLTGSEAEVEAAKTAYRVYGARANDEENYLVDHSTLSYLMAPGEGLLGFFRRDLPAEEMAEDIACFAEAL